MVNLPLVVTRRDGARFFDDASYDALTDGRLWVEVDASRAGDAAPIAALQRDLRDSLFGEDAWIGLAPSRRTSGTSPSGRAVTRSGRKQPCGGH